MLKLFAFSGNSFSLFIVVAVLLSVSTAAHPGTLENKIQQALQLLDSVENAGEALNLDEAARLSENLRALALTVPLAKWESVHSRRDVHDLALRLDNLKNRAIVTEIELPCVEIKQFEAARLYRPHPFHMPYSDWQFSESAGPCYQVGISGSFESPSTGADWARWWRLWLRFDTSIFDAYPYSTVVEAEIVITGINIHWGAGESGGMSVRLFRLFDDASGQNLLSPRNWRDTDRDFNPVPPSQTGTPYDLSSSRLKIYGYGSPNEIARINPLIDEVDLWQREGNYGIIIGAMSLGPQDYGHRFHIREIKQENIVLRLRIRH